MIFLGIDYGTKRVGVAVSDESGRVALPLSVIDHSNLVGDIVRLVTERSIGTIILGESKNFSGVDKPVMADIREFKMKLEHQLKNVPGIAVIFEPEFLTSHQ